MPIVSELGDQGLSNCTHYVLAQNNNIKHHIGSSSSIHTIGEQQEHFEFHPKDYNRKKVPSETIVYKMLRRQF